MATPAWVQRPNCGPVRVRSLVVPGMEGTGEGPAILNARRRFPPP